MACAKLFIGENVSPTDHKYSTDKICTINFSTICHKTRYLHINFSEACSTYVEKCNKLLMDIDFDLFSYCLGEFMKCSAGVYTFLFISKIHPNAEIRDQNLSPSKVVTFFFIGRYMSLTFLQIGGSSCYITNSM